MEIIETMVKRYPALAVCEREIRETISTLAACFEAGKRLYICGNGGSAADALHMAGELVKSFTRKRPLDDSFVKKSPDPALMRNLQGALPVIPLVENTSLATAFANDCDPAFVFAQQVYAYAREGDCVLGISTSGNSANIIHALGAAKGRGSVALGLAGAHGGKMKGLCSVCICVPETEVYKVQELHMPVYHAICLALEKRFWGEIGNKNATC